MRRTLPLLVTATLLFAACSGSDDDASDTSANDTASTDEPSDTTDTSGTEVEDTTAPPATNPDKPEVEIPTEIPTELTVTVIESGSGPEAEAGDTVVVDYVGVRSSDGVEFDSSYDRFQPFNVVLGQGSVIAGWDQGLEGVQAGSRIQLDIPSDLAYGAEARGDIIGENEALTFVIDVLAVGAPTEAGVEASTGAEGVETVDLREGTGDELVTGQTAVINYALYRGDNLIFLVSNWDQQPAAIPVVEGTFPVLFDGLQGMKVGGRRAITFPPNYPEFGFGPEGSPTDGLPANTDVIMVVDLLAAYDAG